VHPPGGRGGGHLGADPARADDDQPGAGSHGCPQRERVRLGPQGGARAGQPARLRTGGQHAAVEGQLPGVGRDRMVADRRDPDAEPQVDVQRGPVRLQRGVVGLADQQRLGQRRPVVRRLGLGAEQGQRAGVPL
jgi:hypothetical protein